MSGQFEAFGNAVRVFKAAVWAEWPFTLVARLYEWLRAALEEGGEG